MGIVFAIWFFRHLDSFGKLLTVSIGIIGLYGLLSALGTASWFCAVKLLPSVFK